MTAPPRPTRRAQPAVPLALAGATVLTQILYPLTGGGLRNGLTVLTVLLFAAASLTAAGYRHGRFYAQVLLAVTVVGGFVAEAVGVATGLPFGDYAYAGTLGPRVLGVPLVIPLAWTMMAYPARVVGLVCARGPVGRIGVGALALASWDVFLDPQMTDAGHWRFAAHDGPTLTGIPLVNFAGWLLVAVVLMAALELLLPEERGHPTLAQDAVPLGLYLWTYASSLLANLVFFDRPDVALSGGLVMGVPVTLLVLRLRGAPRLRR